VPASDVIRKISSANPIDSCARFIGGSLLVALEHAAPRRRPL
jgi:hypothetical protein